MVMKGGEDRVVAEACFALYAATVPDATRVTIDRAGHYPHIEQPEAFVREVVRFAQP